MFCFQTSTSINAYFDMNKILIFESFHGLLEENRLPVLYFSNVSKKQYTKIIDKKRKEKK